MVDATQTSPRIRKISPPHEHRDSYSRLRNSWPGQLYINYLKQYAIVRGGVHWAWRNLFPIYTRLMLYMAAKYPLTKLSVFISQNNLASYKLEDSSLVSAPSSLVFPTSDYGYLVAPHDQFTFPEIVLTTINSAVVYGESNLVMADGKTICHDLYDFARDYTSEELHGRALVNPKTRSIKWRFHDDAPESIPAAASFVDACAPNYAHWLTEVLPRIALFCSDARFKDIPIVVNDGLHNNLMASLLLVAGTEREIITLPIGRAMNIAKLYLVSPTGYVPFDRRTDKLSGHSHGIFSPRALERLRDTLITFDQEMTKNLWPEKIFLRRNSGARNIDNATELEKIMVDHGYTLIDPGSLSFPEQIQLFKNAKEIVAPTGAALANAIFCTKGTHIVVLMAKHEKMIYRYWVNMLSPLQLRVSYVLGNIGGQKGLGIHGNYSVDPTHLLNALASK